MTHTHVNSASFSGMTAPRYRGGVEKPIRLTTHYLRITGDEWAAPVRVQASQVQSHASTPSVILSEKEVAMRLKCGHSTLRLMRRNGQAPKHFTLGHRVKYTLASVEGWLVLQGEK